VADPTKEDLLVEYRECHEDAREFTTRSWQIAGVVLVFGFGGIVLVAARTNHTPADVALTGAVGVFASGVIWLWFAIYSRLRLLYLVTYHRIHEIERIVGLKKNLYVDVVDNWKSLDSPNRIALSDSDIQGLTPYERLSRRWWIPTVTFSVTALSTGGTIAWVAVFTWDLVLTLT
jgi:hypothetical protein